MTAELRDFARSILRMDGERAMWFERSQELAKKCDALTAELDKAVTERDAAREELYSTARERDILRESVKAWQDAEATARGRWHAEKAERDAARDELDKAATERNAPEARLAALTPAPVEVDGFRVGDLVRFNGEALPLLEVFFDETVGHSFGTVSCDSPYRRKSCSQLRHMVRKTVEVGDAVRIVKGGLAGRTGRVDSIVDEDAHVVHGPGARPGEVCWLTLSTLVAVAP